VKQKKKFQISFNQKMALVVVLGVGIMFSGFYHAATLLDKVASAHDDCKQACLQQGAPDYQLTDWCFCVKGGNVFRAKR